MKPPHFEFRCLLASLLALIAGTCFTHAGETTASDDLTAWNRVPPGLHSGFGTTDVAYPENTMVSNTNQYSWFDEGSDGIRHGLRRLPALGLQ